MTLASPISDYAVIGNGFTAALVNRQGSIDWCCLPRFDSGAVFCRLLDVDHGGFFQISPDLPSKVDRRYLPSTNVLETTFTTAAGVLRVTDCMPAPSTDEPRPTVRHCILRRIDCLSGPLQVQVNLRPTFDYARALSHCELHDEGGTIRSGSQWLDLRCPAKLSATEIGLTGSNTLRSGDVQWAILTYGQSCQSYPAYSPTTADTELEQTTEYWRRWCDRCRYAGPYRELVLRSAVTLKLLVYEPSGGIIAAPTTSLPAEIGGQRNWDYRFTWLRDAGMLLDSLQQLGYHDESKRFIDWLEQLCLHSDDGLRIMYRMDGKAAPDEHTLDHLAGYRNSRPVRIGNGATNQQQIDVYGHVLDAVVLCFERMPRDLKPELWRFLRTLADRAAERWEQPDQGPWEFRGPAQQYLYSKLCCWVGLDRAIRFAEKRQLDADLERWKEQRSRLRDAIESQGYNDDTQAFTQAFGTKTLDATGLAIALTYFLPATDRRVRSTIQQIDTHLSDNGLLYRYRNDDHLPGQDATFTLCGFWMVMNLALAGEVEQATSRFEHLCSFANDVGLMSEQIDAGNGQLLGNFPQGFSHLGLIRAALHLQDAQTRSKAPVGHE